MNTLFENEEMLFPTTQEEIMQRIRSIDPIKYGKNRNFIDGSVTYLSPYISRGVISTKQILSSVLERGYSPKSIEKFIQELAWRDYWQQIWIAKGEAINSDLKNLQQPIASTEMVKSIAAAKTGISAIDTAIVDFYKTGYLHNHLRMYIASLACNTAQCHWKYPAKWMYYHLLDADWASNALSWQWVAGANSNKKYYANQENINKYCYSNQKETFLDLPYSAFENLEIPEILQEVGLLDLTTPLPRALPIQIDASLPTLLYNLYNLDSLWKKGVVANRVLLLEPSHFEEYPVSQKTLDFVLALSENIENIQVFVGEFPDLKSTYPVGAVYFKEHPLNQHYKGIEESRDWMFPVEGYYRSFFAFWKKCKKNLTY
jgi:deoxyribodipyrimidine photo-lyase